ncbi:MAG: FadR family transcriptional regulator [Rhodobacteraceae bacterium]|nr:FadR family transcriptional regulator [Paracoccaceae bacterium]
MNNHSEQRRSSADIATLIRQEIVKGNLSFHERLSPERKLAETYNVARGTIREALNRLEQDGLVKIQPGSGTYVIYQSHEASASAIEDANPLEMMDARFALEPHICRLAVLHGRRSEFDELEKLCARMEDKLHDPTAFAQADTEFHRGLAKCTHNGLLIWIIDQITSVRSQDEWRRMRHLTLEDGIITRYNHQHRQIFDAIRAREPEHAANLMKEHLETARLSLTRAAET